MRYPQIERRSKRNVPRQCVSDYGMHKDAKSVAIRAVVLRDDEEVAQANALSATSKPLQGDT